MFNEHHPLYAEWQQARRDYRQRHPFDPARTQAELDAWLIEHGRAVAVGLGLDLANATEEHLLRLGRVDAIAQHPGMDQEWAVRLAWIRATRWNIEHEAAHEVGMNHDHVHARLPDPTADHRRLQELGMEVDQEHVQDGARDALSNRPEGATIPEPSGVDQGRGDSHTKSQPPETPVQNGKVDPIKEYLSRSEELDEEHDWWSS
jgi:hypothetical protein